MNTYEELEKTLFDEQAETDQRISALMEIVRLADSRRFDAILRAAGDKEASIRRKVAEALRQLSSASVRAEDSVGAQHSDDGARSREVLIKMLSDPDPGVRLRASRSLGSAAAPGSAAACSAILAALKDAQNDENLLVRSEAEYALRTLKRRISEIAQGEAKADGKGQSPITHRTGAPVLEPDAGQSVHRQTGQAPDAGSQPSFGAAEPTPGQESLSDGPPIASSQVQPDTAAEEIVIESADDGQYADASVASFLRDHEHESAVTVITKRQLFTYFLIFFGLFFLVSFDWLYFLIVINLLSCTFYIMVILYKLLTVCLSLIKKQEISVSRLALMRLRDDALPIYTILVPLYKEKEVANKIVKAINALDYPKDRLDVKLLLEADDEETIAACKQAGLPGYFEMLIIPDSIPKTKPKACNHGLARARGKYLVIYDAEDRPESDQLKKAIIGFQKAKERTTCLQAKLNYYNPRQNLLTKWFTIEYTTWFDLYLPGLHALRAPIPLGGTSNHFKTKVLREVGGWDPFNVTEDCDLGMRLHRRGYLTQVLDTTTWEEANSRLGNWIRQRSRWVKGYIQTHLVHKRHPWRTFREMGPFSYLSFLLSVGGLSLMLLLNPIFWFVGALYCGLWIVDLSHHGWSITKVWSLYPENRWSWQMIFSNPDDSLIWNRISIIFYFVTLALVAANFIFIFLSVAACKRRRLRDLTFLAALSPFYWILISIGAWKGFLQLLWKPFYWEKTVHGFYEEPADELQDRSKAGLGSD